MARMSEASRLIGGVSNLEAKLDSRENNFNLVRLVLALLVCFDHAGLVWSGQTHTELLRIGSVTAGFLAVNGFFVLSGMLIMRSLERGGAGLSYYLSRFLRLYPGLLALALVSVFIIGPLVSRQDYWVGIGVLEYAAQILRFGDTMGAPIGFYPNNPYPLEFNSPLWTLRYELICYLVAPIILLLGVFERRYFVAVMTCLAGVLAWVYVPHENPVLGSDFLAACLRFAFCFGIGMNIWLWRRWVSTRPMWVLLSGALFGLSLVVGVGVDVAATLFVASAVLYAGLMPVGGMRYFEHVDLSYGVYIWHFPILQILMGELQWANPFFLLAVAVMLVLPVAWLSWEFVERPSLKFKKMILKARLVE
ncbi:acyltransferase family protein [Hirschia litorea]|uniref:Acyltransferase family protein n=1 Tax=Hirschia litorea TaxID=1199156 RepID=A0ABW2IJU6_9PROT